MNILLLHNRYRQRGGEDACVEAHQRLLEARGHRVRLVEADNNLISGRLAQVSAALTAVYSGVWRRRLAAEIATFRPAVAHIHNTFPLLSPGVILACKQARLPIVHTLHNVRLLCPSGVLFRDGRVCEACVGRCFAWPAVLHGCYRGSRMGTAAVAGAYCVHRWLHTYSRQVDVAIALSQFAKNKLVCAGIPRSRITVMPNWVEPDPGIGNGNGGYFLFVGRLSPEKGVETLLRAWRRVGSGAPLLLVGAGPAEAQLRALSPASVSWLGTQSAETVMHLMHAATALILPSECYENFPRVAVEAFAAGTPVIASRLGSLQEIVHDQVTGLHFAPGDFGQLAEAVAWLLQHPGRRREMRRAARLRYETHYTGERLYPLLLEAYARAMGGAPQDCSVSSQPAISNEEHTYEL